MLKEEVFFNKTFEAFLVVWIWNRSVKKYREKFLSITKVNFLNILAILYKRAGTIFLRRNIELFREDFFYFYVLCLCFIKKSLNFESSFVRDFNFFGHDQEIVLFVDLKSHTGLSMTSQWLIQFRSKKNSLKVKNFIFWKILLLIRHLLGLLLFTSQKRKCLLFSTFFNHLLSLLMTL